MEEKVKEFLKEEFPDTDFSGTSLVDDEVLDSLTLTEIIQALSMEYDIEIPYEEIVEDNFNSLDAIAALVARLVNEKEG